MKQLQNNFTTPEQSKRLLELGVPADSADCYHVVKNNYTAILHNELFTECRDKMIKVSKTSYRVEMHDDDILPCWSVGRLIEIAFICSVYEVRTIDFFRNDSPITDIIYELWNNKMDFSKLED